DATAEGPAVEVGIALLEAVNHVARSAVENAGLGHEGRLSSGGRLKLLNPHEEPFAVGAGGDAVEKQVGHRGIAEALLGRLELRAPFVPAPPPRLDRLARAEEDLLAVGHRAAEELATRVVGRDLLLRLDVPDVGGPLVHV